MRCFNSSVVQLKVKKQRVFYLFRSRFNSSVVQLKEYINNLKFSV